MKTQSSIKEAEPNFPRLPKAIAALPFLFATAFAGSFWAATAQADPLIIGNNAAAGGGPIQTYDFATGGAPVASFVPTGASALLANGRGVLVLGNKVYYTELVGLGGFGPTPSIQVAPFNGGAGGADITTLPNPRPGTGVQDLAIANGVLYVLTGYPFTTPPQVFGLNPVTGAVVSGPVTITGTVATHSDGFTVLPNGNFLINAGDAVCTYNQFNPTTGAMIPATTITLASGTHCTGVEHNGVHLFFQKNFNSFVKTDFTGFVIATTAVTSPFSCGGASSTA